MDDKIPFRQDEAISKILFRSEPRKPPFMRTRVVISPAVVGIVLLTGLAMVSIGAVLNGFADIKGFLGNVVGDVGVALATGAVLFVFERNLFVAERLDERWQKLDIESLLNDVLQELEKRLGSMAKDLQLAYYATIRKGIFRSDQLVYKFPPDGNGHWAQTLELGEGPIGRAVLEQRSLAADVDGWRWCVVPFVGRRRAGCLIAAIPPTDVDDLVTVTETCWSSLSDFSELAASIVEPIVV
jgi:hypothetical protein